MLIKICGMRRHEDIIFVNENRPDYAGFILSAGFKRTVIPELFRELVSELEKSIKAVGVFVDEDIEKVRSLSDRLDVIQLHGSETADYIAQLRQSFNGEIWKAVRASSPDMIERADKLGADKLLIDSFVNGQVGGTGKTADTEIIKKAVFDTPFFLAGGVSAGNVTALCEGISPIGVDASSSVETEGFKDNEKIKALVKAVRDMK